MTFSPAVAAIVAFLVACAYGLGGLSRLVFPAVSARSRIMVSALLVPSILFGAGYYSFVEIAFTDWLLTWPIATWINVIAVVSLSILAAWIAVRRRRSSADSAVF